MVFKAMTILWVTLYLLYEWTEPQGDHIGVLIMATVFFVGAEIIDEIKKLK